MSTSNEGEGPTRRRSPIRRVGIFVLGALAVYVSLVPAYQILKGTFFPELPPTDFDCREGTIALYESLEVVSSTPPAVPLPEREAVEFFRSQLDSTWRYAPSIRNKCRQARDQEALHALRAVELLRYAEERFVRSAALDLAKRRQTTPALVSKLAKTR